MMADPNPPLKKLSRLTSNVDIDNLGDSLPRTYFRSESPAAPLGHHAPAEQPDLRTTLSPGLFVDDGVHVSPRLTSRSASDKDLLVSHGPQLLRRSLNAASELVVECSGFITETTGDAESASEGGGAGNAVGGPMRRAYSVQQLDMSFRARHGQQLMAFEHYDHHANYYRRHFYAREHQNFLGFDHTGHPVAVSLKRESDPRAADDEDKGRYRGIIRTLEGGDIRMTLPESSVHIRSKLRLKATAKDIIVSMAPSVHISKLQLVTDPKIHEMLMKLDEQLLVRQYKFGVMYCAAGQSSEEDMYNNMSPSKFFTDFLGVIGETVKLRGFCGFKAGLDVKSDSTGTESVYTRLYDGDVEVMFHVSTMLPSTPANRQQLQRKRHIGNDIVTIIFQDPGAPAFSPLVIRSHFQHIFIVVRPVVSAAGTKYK
eukprot:Opistho-2@49254